MAQIYNSKDSPLMIKIIKPIDRNHLLLLALKRHLFRININKQINHKMKDNKNHKNLMSVLFLLLGVIFFYSCGNPGNSSQANTGVLSGDAASQVYVAPGEYDEFY